MFYLRAHYTQPAFAEGARAMLPVAPGIAAWGLMTGVAMVQSGLSTVEALSMALLVFAGSSQLAAMPLMAAGAPMWVILATGFCVNLRFVVFSAHLRPYMLHLPLVQRLAAGYFTADLSYVLFTQRHPAPVPEAERATPAGQALLLEQQAYLAGTCGVNWASWAGSSVLGVALAHVIPLHWGLGFAGILALVGILCSLIGSRMQVLAAGMGATAAVAAYALPLKLNILVAIAAAVALCLVVDRTPRTATPAQP